MQNHKYENGKSYCRLPIHSDEWFTAAAFRFILKRYNITLQDWYDKYVLQIDSINDRPKCPICGKTVRFINAVRGYAITCSHSCHTQYQVNTPGMKEQIAATLRQHYSIEDNKIAMRQSVTKAMQRPEVKKKMSASLVNAHLRGVFDKHHAKSRGKAETIVVQYHINNRKQIRVRSQLEKLTITYIEQLKLQHGYEVTKIPYYVDNIKHCYSIDHTLFITNKLLLIETKPAALLNDKYNIAKYNAAKEYAMQNDNILDYIVVTDYDLQTIDCFKLKIAQYMQ